jgi:hypothetical protein
MKILHQTFPYVLDIRAVGEKPIFRFFSFSGLDAFTRFSLELAP